MPDFAVGDRVRHIDSGREGRVVSIDNYPQIELDNGESTHCLLDGGSCCAGGDFEPVPEPMEETPIVFELNQRVRYSYPYHSATGVITEINDQFIRITMDDQLGYEGGDTTRSFNLDGRGPTGEFDSAVTDGRIKLIPDTIETPFTVDQRVQYCMSSGDTAVGTVTKIDDEFVFVTLDADQHHVRYVGHLRVFRHDGAGTGNIRRDLPYGQRATEAGSVLIPAPPEWTQTPGREYPEEPRIAYGVFDNYYGRPLQQNDPVGHGPRIGWGVINVEDNGFSQGIYPTEEEAKSAGYLTTAKSRWKNQCLDIDLKAIENPFDLLIGCDIDAMWLHADNFGCEFYLPAALSARMLRSMKFNYPRACATAGLMTMDELNKWFLSNRSNMEVVEVDGTKITMKGDDDTITFHVLPKLIEDFKPEPYADNPKTKELLLLNLAMQSAARDSTHDEALAIAA